MMNINMEQYLKDLEYMVNIDSGTTCVEGIEQVSCFLKGKYEQEGFQVKEYVFDQKYGPCIEARNKPEADHIDLLLIGHMDTVFPKGTALERPFRMEDGKAYGPGVADMKSGDLMTVALAGCLNREFPDISICIAHNCDEEYGSPSSRQWLNELGKISSYCLDFEPGRTDGSFVKTRKGVCKLVITMKGKSAHAGVNPDQGASAILEMSRWVCEFTGKTRFNDARVNFGVMKGGTVYNMVPDFAQCDVDIRFDTWEGLYAVFQEFECRAKNPFTDNIQIEIEKKAFTPPMTTNESSVALMKIFEEEAEKIGQRANFVGTGGGSDASAISDVGVATIDSCGPIGFNTHNQGEYIILDSIQERYSLLYRVCVRLFAEKD